MRRARLLSISLALWAICAALLASEMLFAPQPSLSWGAAGLALLAGLAPAAALWRGAETPVSPPSPADAPPITPHARGPRLTARPALAPAAPAPRPAEAAPPQSAPPAPPADDAPRLPLEEAAPPPPVDWALAARALDFPRDEEDAAGFAAIEAALRDPELARLLQASEDVLTMLATSALHMEDFPPQQARMQDWRAYAEGARGAGAAAVGGVQDAAALEATRARQRADAVFRDACLALIRRWRTMIARALAEGAGEAEIAALADSRSGRAFMLTARAAGAFD